MSFSREIEQGRPEYSLHAYDVYQNTPHEGLFGNVVSLCALMRNTSSHTPAVSPAEKEENMLPDSLSVLL